MNLIGKKNKVTVQEAQRKSAQDLIPIKAIDSGIVLTSDNRLVQIMKVGALNTELMSQNELHLLLESYEAFLKSLTFRIQQEIVSEPVDLKQYIHSQEEQLEKTIDFNRRLLLKSYIDYTKSMETSRQIIRRQRYIIFDVKIKGSTNKDYEEAVYEIEDKKDHITSGLRDLDLSCQPINNVEIVRFFHIFFNYDGALHQRINPDMLQNITIGNSVYPTSNELSLLRQKAVGTTPLIPMMKIRSED